MGVPLAGPPDASGEPALVATGVNKTYVTPAGPIQAVRDLTVEIAWGEFVAIMGPSGSGKTTVLGLLAGLIAPDEGSPAVCLDGKTWKDPAHRTTVARRRRECALVHQGVNLIDFLTVGENVAFPLLMSGMAQEAAMASTREWLERFELADTAARRPRELSGGQQQRVAIARAAAAGQRVLLADEPTGALDSRHAATVFESIRRHARRGGVAVVVSHNDLVRRYADRVLLLEDGVLSP